MSFMTANEMADSLQKPSKSDVSFHMAEVTAVTSGAPYLTFYGDSSQRSKSYKYLSSYSPTVGDIVLCAKINGSYVILGEVVS